MNLKEAVELALHGFLDIQECESIHYAKGRVKPLIDYLRAALVKDAMQRLTDEQQMIERGTKAWADVPDATAWVEELRGNKPVTDCHEKEWDHIPDATKMVEPVAYVTGFSKGYAIVEPVDRSLLMPVGMALYRSPPTSQKSRQVKPVAWMVYTLDGQSAFVTDNPADFTPEHRALPLYTAPPKRNPMTEQQLDEMFDQAEIAIYIADRQQKEHLEVYSFGVRDAEKWHGIGGGE